MSKHPQFPCTRLHIAGVISRCQTIMTMWYQVLVCIVLHGLVASVQGLEISMERTPGQDICARLQCSNDVTADGNIFSTTSIAIFDVSQPGVTIKLASVSANTPGIYINQSKVPDVNGTGSISRYHANLTLTFRNDDDCSYGTFQCVLEFVNVKGEIDTLRQTSAPVSSGCSCSGLAQRVNALERELAELRLNRTLVEAELSALIQLSTQLENRVTALSQQVFNIQSLLTSTSVAVSTLTSTQASSQALPSSCDKGMAHARAREKFLLWNKVEALCDTETDGGGWVIIQRRTRGDVNFYQDWDTYKSGFGTPDTDYWIGNDAIHNLTSQSYNELRVELQLNGVMYFAHYSAFNVDNEFLNYRLSVSGYSGSAGDSLAYHNGAMFSTSDRDHDTDPGSCAIHHTSAWWYKSCYDANLNGVWGKNDDGGVIWAELSKSVSVTFTEMKLRHR